MNKKVAILGLAVLAWLAQESAAITGVAVFTKNGTRTEEAYGPLCGGYCESIVGVTMNNFALHTVSGPYICGSGFSCDGQNVMDGWVSHDGWDIRNFTASATTPVPWQVFPITPPLPGRRTTAPLWAAAPSTASSLPAHPSSSPDMHDHRRS